MGVDGVLCCVWFGGVVLSLVWWGVLSLVWWGCVEVVDLYEVVWNLGEVVILERICDLK